MKILMLAIAALLAAPPLAPAAPKRMTRDLLIPAADAPAPRPYPLSPTVKPCEDFHRYVCEETEKSFKLPADRAVWIFAFMENQERMIAAKRNYFKLLGEGYEPRTKRAGQIKDFYLACMNPDAGAAEERAMVATQKARVEKIKTREEFSSFLGDHIASPDASFVGMGAAPKLSDPDYFDVGVGAGGLSLPDPSYYQDAATVKELKDFVASFFSAAGLERAEERAQAVVEFEQGLAKVTPPLDVIRRRRDEPRYVTRAELQKAYPHVSFAAFLKHVPANVELRDYLPETLRYVSDALGTLPLATLKDLYLYQELKDVIDDSNPEYFHKYFALQQRLGGPAERPVREKRCVQSATENLGMELDEDLLPLLFPNFPTERVKKLAEEIRASILKGLRDNEWLTPGTRAEAIKKIERARLALVKPERTEDWNFLPERKYDATKPLTNERAVEQLKIDRMLERLKAKRNRRQWGAPPLTINAFYEPANNSFTLPQGILQPPFFDAKMTDAQLLASFGTIVGHELGHAIDNSGSKYDFEGRLRNWKAAADEKEFDARTERFVKAFDGMGVNGKLTLGENIGDHEGVTFAFAAAFPKPAAAKPTEVKDFFLSFARDWCLVTTPAAAELRLKRDEHSPGWARINGQVKQLGAFHEAFGCKAGDPMFLPPSERVRVW